MPNSKKKKIVFSDLLDALSAPLSDVLNSHACRARFPPHEPVEVDAFMRWMHKSSSATAVALLSVARRLAEENKISDSHAGPGEPLLLHFLLCNQGGLDLSTMNANKYLKTLSVKNHESLERVGEFALSRAVPHEVPFYFHAIRTKRQRQPEAAGGPRMRTRTRNRRQAFATQVVVRAWDTLSEFLGYSSCAWIYEYLRLDQSTLQFIARDAKMTAGASSQSSLKKDAMHFCAIFFIETLQDLLQDPLLYQSAQAAAWPRVDEFLSVNGELPPIFRAIPSKYARVLGIHYPEQASTSPAVESPPPSGRDATGGTGHPGIMDRSGNKSDAGCADDTGSGNAEAVGIKRARVKTESVHEPEDSSRLSGRRVRQRVEPVHVPARAGAAQDIRSEEDLQTEDNSLQRKAPAPVVKLEGVLREAPGGFVRSTAMPLHVTAAVATLNQMGWIFSNFRDVCTSEWSEEAMKALRSADPAALEVADATAAKVIIERGPGTGGGRGPYRTVACGRFVKDQVVCDVFGTMLYQEAKSLPEAWVDELSGRVVRKEEVIGSLVRVGTCAGPFRGSVVPVLLSPARFSVAAHIRVVGGLDRHNAVFEVGSSTISADNVEKAGFVCVRALRNISRGEEVVVSMEATTLLG